MKPMRRIIIKSGTRPVMSLLGCNQMLIQFYVCLLVSSPVELQVQQQCNSVWVKQTEIQSAELQAGRGGYSDYSKYSLSGLVSFHPRKSPPSPSFCGSVSLSYGR